MNTIHTIESVTDDLDKISAVMNHLFLSYFCQNKPNQSLLSFDWHRIQSFFLIMLDYLSAASDSVHATDNA